MCIRDRGNTAQCCCIYYQSHSTYVSVDGCMLRGLRQFHFDAASCCTCKHQSPRNSTLSTSLRHQPQATLKQNVHKVGLLAGRMSSRLDCTTMSTCCSERQNDTKHRRGTKDYVTSWFAFSVPASALPNLSSAQKGPSCAVSNYFISDPRYSMSRLSSLGYMAQTNQVRSGKANATFIESPLHCFLRASNVLEHVQP